MKAIGKVSEVCDDYARVTSERLSACASCNECSAKSACHAHLVFGNQSEVVTVIADNKVDAKVGDMVELESSTSVTLLMCFAAFVFPLVLSATAYWILNILTDHSNVSPLLLIAVFVICFVITVFVINSFIKKKASAVIVRIIEESK